MVTVTAESESHNFSLCWPPSVFIKSHSSTLYFEKTPQMHVNLPPENRILLPDTLSYYIRWDRGAAGASPTVPTAQPRSGRTAPGSPWFPGTAAGPLHLEEKKGKEYSCSCCSAFQPSVSQINAPAVWLLQGTAVSQGIPGDLLEMRSKNVPLAPESQGLGLTRALS